MQLISWVQKETCNKIASIFIVGNNHVVVNRVKYIFLVLFLGRKKLWQSTKIWNSGISVKLTKIQWVPWCCFLDGSNYSKQHNIKR